jgi:hypothetical protein
MSKRSPGIGGVLIFLINGRGQNMYTNILKLIEFCILMQNNDGIIGKSPSYILEKWENSLGDGTLLDSHNLGIFNKYKRLWFERKK